MKKLRILLRDEYKLFERRCAITPTFASILNSLPYYEVMVSKSKSRCYEDSEYEKSGLKIVPRFYWVTKPEEVDIVIGLKDLPEGGEVIDGVKIPEKLVHSHLYCGHCYKGQQGWKKLMKRFIAGGGELVDYEFLQTSSRSLSLKSGMSIPAGIVGCGLGLLTFFGVLSEEKTNVTRKGDFRKQEFIDLISSEIKNKPSSELPKILIMGYKGKVGAGCIQVCEEVGISKEQLLLWDFEETKQGGPFLELATDVDIICNCVYLTKKIPPFLDFSTLEKAKEENGSVRLKILVDISCDVSSDNNPFPINNEITTFENPIKIIEHGIKVISIDHLPSLIPRESSYQFSELLMKFLPYFVMRDGTILYDKEKDGVRELEESAWKYSRKCYDDKKAEVLEE